MNFKTLDVKLLFALALGCFLVVGCGGEKNSNKTASIKSNFDASPYVADKEIPGALNVIELKKKSKDKDKIVVVGRIGGSIDPWVSGRAAFSIVDRSIKACSDETPDGEACSCETPWDYCCETDKLRDGMVLVKFVDTNGNVIKQDAKIVFALKELQTVTIEGTAQRDTAGNLTVLATRMYAAK